MYYQPEAMLEQYDIEIKQITKGRGVFCCETDQGKKVLAPFRGSAERAKFVREILCSMQEKGTVSYKAGKTGYKPPDSVYAS